MLYVVVDGTGKPLGAFRTKAEAQRSKTSWSRELRSSGRRSVYDRLKIVKRGNPSGRVTKSQKRLNASKRSKLKRVATALQKYLHQQNPGMKTVGASIQKLKGGVLKITPIKANRSAKR